MKTRNILIGAAVVIVLLILVNGFYVVDETEQVVITQFGRPIGESIKDAGLHWKLPFIQAAHYFDERILEWDGDPNQIPTKDKKYIWVDMTARWRIVDPLTFLQSVGNEMGAQSRLDDMIDAKTRDLVSDNMLVEIVRNSNRDFIFQDTELIQDTLRVNETIELGRDYIRKQILAGAKQGVIQFGIELVDVRIKRVNYVEEVRQKVYERMTSERKRIAERYRSEGQGQMAEIEGTREKELQRIRSEAYEEAQRIRGRADAEATRIYAGAYNNDPEFYSFLKSLETYRTTLDSSTTVLLTTKADYLKYIKGAR
jgi:membrane protease subunit HflC